MTVDSSGDLGRDHRGERGLHRRRPADSSGGHVHGRRRLTRDVMPYCFWTSVPIKSTGAMSLRARRGRDSGW